MSCARTRRRVRIGREGPDRGQVQWRHPEQEDVRSWLLQSTSVGCSCHPDNYQRDIFLKHLPNLYQTSVEFTVILVELIERLVIV